jgi:hypothetical protein
MKREMLIAAGVGGALGLVAAIGHISAVTSGARPASSASMARVSQGRCNEELRSVVQSHVQAWGYRCDSLNFCSPDLWGKTIRVVCNEHRYTYNVVDRGGNWLVQVMD